MTDRGLKGEYEQNLLQTGDKSRLKKRCKAEMNARWVVSLGFNADKTDEKEI